MFVILLNVHFVIIILYFTWNPNVFLKMVGTPDIKLFTIDLRTGHYIYIIHKYIGSGFYFDNHYTNHFEKLTSIIVCSTINQTFLGWKKNAK